VPRRPNDRARRQADLRLIDQLESAAPSNGVPQFREQLHPPRHGPFTPFRPFDGWTCRDLPMSAAWFEVKARTAGGWARFAEYNREVGAAEELVGGDRCRCPWPLIAVCQAEADSQIQRPAVDDDSARRRRRQSVSATRPAAFGSVPGRGWRTRRHRLPARQMVVGGGCWSWIRSPTPAQQRIARQDVPDCRWTTLKSSMSSTNTETGPAGQMPFVGWRRPTARRTASD